MTESLPYPGDMVRRQNLGEELLNAISHGAGALLSVAGLVLLLIKAKTYGTVLNVVSVGIFGVSMVVLYLISCLYHALPMSKGKKVFQVLDHCSIFLLIMGTYTPVCLVTMGGVLGFSIFAVNVSCGILGIILNAVDLKRFKKISMVLYIVMGWMGVLALPFIIRNMSLAGVIFLFLGGVSYTVGVIFYRQKEKLYRHGIWHFFVLGGTIFQFFTVYMNCCS
ncbi:MAG: hemolysin III family protein [Evtepia sp.]|uniref:PAQR family membrane homeostasis protein TrhA n=1 Tax=Evtepia sp. TaxID=2773933 RepID=UPI002A74F663|nr:hemolysin III family protein [Evtepia sp.]MDY3014043.1 hemolysin III family protein [Evtepia sp.]